MRRWYIFEACLTSSLSMEKNLNSINIFLRKKNFNVASFRFDPETGEIEPGRKKAKKDFKLNIYSFYFEAVGASKKRRW